MVTAGLETLAPLAILEVLAARIQPVVIVEAPTATSAAALPERIWMPARRAIVAEDMHQELMTDIRASLRASQNRLGAEMSSASEF